MAREISNTDDVIDSRDVIARIEELEEEREDILNNIPDTDDSGRHVDVPRDAEECHEAALLVAEWDEDNGAELAALKSLADEAEGYAADWHHGSTLIRDSYFEDYARELAEDIGAMPDTSAWPGRCIDWEEAAGELQMDYTSVDFDGVTYWVR